MRRLRALVRRSAARVSCSNPTAFSSAVPPTVAALGGSPPSLVPETDALLASLLASTHSSLTAEEASTLTTLLRRFAVDPGVADRAHAEGVPPSLLSVAVTAFRRTLLAAAPRDVVGSLLQPAPPGRLSSAASRERTALASLFPLFRAFAAAKYGAVLEKHAPLLAAADLPTALAGPAFPLARSLKRRLVYHAGPTNSGKTHAALTALRAAQSGVYCAPLRLLAMEAYDSLNVGGVFCSLRTGQEVRDVPSARHVACTVEMAECGPGAQAVDVAVLDEIQLLADEHRGWAWTRATAATRRASPFR